MLLAIAHKQQYFVSGDFEDKKRRGVKGWNWIKLKTLEEMQKFNEKDRRRILSGNKKKRNE